MSWLSPLVVPPLVAPAAADVQVGDFFFNPAAVRVAQGAGVEWSFEGSFDHTVPDSSGMGLFDSSPRNNGMYPFTFVAAGSYP